MKLNNVKAPLLAAFLFCVAFLTYWLFQSYSFAPHDYSNSYFGAYFFLKGQFNLDIFDPYTFNTKIYNEGFKNIFASYCPNPPFTAIFFTPFALLPLPFSKLLFNVLSCILFLISVYRLVKHLDIPLAPVYLFLPIIFFIPIRNEILFGQTYFLIIFVLAEGYLAYVSDRKILAASLWALSILIKVFPIIIVLCLLLNKDWKTFLYLIGACLLLLLSSVLVQGIDVWSVYFTKILPQNGNGEITSAYLINYQSAHMFFKYALLPNADLNPSPLISSSFLFQGFQILYKSIVLALCTSVILKRKDLLSFGLLMLGSIMLSPYGSTYTNLLLVMVLLAAYKTFTPKALSICVILIFLISNFPISLLNSWPVLLQFPRLVFYCLLLASLFYYSFSKFQVYSLFIFTCLFSVPVILHSETPTNASALLFKEHNQSLIFDYTVSQNHLAYTYWSDHGYQTRHTEMNVKSISTKNIEVKNNQIFYNGKQLTNTSDTKLKPSLVNDDSIIYLSDKDRGSGFYNLRIMKLHEGI